MARQVGGSSVIYDRTKQEEIDRAFPDPYSRENYDTLATVLRRWRGSPNTFVKEQWPDTFLWSKQREILDALRDSNVVAVQSCHGSGKTLTAALATLWEMSCYRPVLCMSTAPIYKQVNQLLWKELRVAIGSMKKRIFPKIPGLTPEWIIDQQCRAYGYSSDRPLNTSGWHERFGIVAADEACGIADVMWDPLYSFMSTGIWRLLMLSNPTVKHSEFRRRSLQSDCITIKISAYDTPNFTGEEVPQVVKDSLISKQWVEGVIEKYGIDSAYVKARVFGEYPEQGTDVLIPEAWINEAVRRTVDPLKAPQTVTGGVDVAGKNGRDHSALWQVDCGVARKIWSERNSETMATTGRIAKFIEKSRAELTAVDETGLGEPMVDRLYELQGDRRLPGGSVVGMNFAHNSNRPNEFVTMRDELWWELRVAIKDWLAIPDSPKLISELSDIGFAYLSDGRIKLEKKELWKKRHGGGSPDDAEALALAVWAAVQCRKSSRGERRYAYPGSESDGRMPWETARQNW